MVEKSEQTSVMEEDGSRIKRILERRILDLARQAQNPIIAVRRNVFSDPQIIETLFEISGDGPAIVINSRGEIIQVDPKVCKSLAEEVVRGFGFNMNPQDLIPSKEITTLKFAKKVGFFKSATTLGLSLIETTVTPVTGGDTPPCFSWSISNRHPQRLPPVVKI